VAKLTITTPKCKLKTFPKIKSRSRQFDELRNRHAITQVAKMKFLIRRFHAQMETSFSLKPDGYFYRTPVLCDDLTKVRPEGGRARPRPAQQARIRCRFGSDCLPERHVKAGFFAKLYFKFHQVWFLGEIQQWFV
jgi:hypothetical protein